MIYIFCFLIYLVGGLAVVVGYHRALSHRAVQLSPLLEKILVTIALPAGTPIQWVGNHRKHHAHADKLEDPHSPHTASFWYAHTGWYIQKTNTILCILYALAGPMRAFIDGYMRPRTNQEYNHLASDIASNPYYKLISKPLPFLLLVWGNISACLVIGYLLNQSLGIVAVSITWLIIYNIGDSIDSVAHTIGRKVHTDQSRNNIVLAMLAFGDGWHSNHHRNPKLAQLGETKWQVDLAWIFIRILIFFNVAKSINHK